MVPFLYLLAPWGVFALRLALGAIFVVHGPPKLKHSKQAAAGMGMSAGTVWLVGLVETLGGISVILGFLTQIGALGLAVIMIGALYMKMEKWSVPFTSMEKMGWEFDLVLLCAALAIATVGAGAISIDWLVLGMA